MQEKEEKGKEKKKIKKSWQVRGHMEGYDLPNTHGTWMDKI